MKIQTIKRADLPGVLQNIPNPPEKLFSLGAELKDERRITIVGTRKPTSYGREVTEMLARDLTNAGAIIVSGLALGIDSIAHQACLDAGGRSIAVLPCGLDTIYPASHRNLAKDILAKNGTLLSEYDKGTEAFKSNFRERNRLVSGLSEAVIITEAAERSGTSITAGFALEQGKDVYVVPGNITSPNSKGTNGLIAQGANVITSSSSLIDQLNLTPSEKRQLTGDSELETLILNLIQEGVREGSKLQFGSGVGVSEYNQAITMMEVTGKIRSIGSNQWTIT
jgi:DNA processing protein